MSNIFSLDAQYRTTASLSNWWLRAPSGSNSHQGIFALQLTMQLICIFTLQESLRSNVAKGFPHLMGNTYLQAIVAFLALSTLVLGKSVDFIYL